MVALCQETHRQTRRGCRSAAGGGRVPDSENNRGYAQFAHLQVFEPKNGLSALTAVPDLALQCRIYRRGQTTSGNPKVSLRVEAQDENGEGKGLVLTSQPPIRRSLAAWRPSSFAHNPLPVPGF